MLWLAMGAGAAMAQVVPALQVSQGPIPIQGHAQAWVDATGEAQVARVAFDPSIRWSDTTESQIYPLATGKVLWLRFTVPASPNAERWYLEVPYPSVNRVTLYTSDFFGRWAAQNAGDTIAVADWPVPHRHPLLPLAASPQAPRVYLLRVENAHSFSAPMALATDSYLSQSEQQVSLIVGMYFGLALLAILLAVLGAISMRDRGCALYAASVAVLALAQAAMMGMAGMHLWPRWPWWNDVSPIVLPVLGVGIVQAFFGATVSLGERSPRLNYLLNGVALAAVPVALAILLVEPSKRIALMVPYIVVATNVGLALVVWALRRGDRYAPWLLAGAVPVAIGAIFPLARTIGLIPVGFLSQWGMQLGIAVELPVLLVMLLLRSQHRREHTRRMQELDRIDPATGLINASVFHERLVRLVSRSVRLKIRSALLLVDLVNIEHIRKDFGREAAQELPLHVAGRLLATSRDIDTVARLSETRFGVLLEGPLTADEVAAAGPRIVARCLMPFKDKPLEWAAQVRVAQALIPMDGTDPAALMGQLETLLITATGDPKRAVYLLRPVPVPGAIF